MQSDAPVEIYVLDRRVRLLQPGTGGFRTGLDAVMLAAACPAKDGQAVLDLGCGVGGACLSLAARVPDLALSGIDVQAGLVALARRNAALNGRQGAAFKEGDIRARDVLPESAFDHVICNPPYYDHGAHTPSPNPVRAAANGHMPRDSEEGAAALQDWLDAAFRALKSKGTLTLIHDAAMVAQIVAGLGRRFGAVEIIPLWPKAGLPAKRVIVRAVKDRRSPATLHPGLVLHEADGTQTKAADAVLRGGEGLFL